MSQRRIRKFKEKVKKLQKALQQKEQEVRDREKALAVAESLSITDSLTGLLNRRGLEMEVERALAQAQRLGLPLAILFIDVDRFKLINDTYGHNVGDVVLKEVATFLKEVVRASDIVTRPGGDEFVIILPSSDLFIAQHVANKIKERIADLDFTHKIQEMIGDMNFTHKVHVGLSIGMSATSEGVRDFDKMKTLADKRMYKEKGSSQVH